MNIDRRRAYSEPHLSYQQCLVCTDYFRRSQQHHDYAYTKCGVCSWVCVMNGKYELKQHLAKKINEIGMIHIQQEKDAHEQKQNSH